MHHRTGAIFRNWSCRRRRIKSKVVLKITNMNEQSKLQKAYQSKCLHVGKSIWILHITAGEIGQWVNELTVEAWWPQFKPWVPYKGEGENSLLKAVCWLSHTPLPAPAHSYTITIKCLSLYVCLNASICAACMSDTYRGQIRGGGIRFSRNGFISVCKPP